MSKRTQRVLWLEFASILLNKLLPHQPTSCIIREWEVYGLIKELPELSLRSFFRLTGAPNNCYPSLISNKLSPPLSNSLLDPCRITWISLFLLSSLFLGSLLSCKEHFLNFINVDNCWLEFLRCNHNSGDHDIFLFLG